MTQGTGDGAVAPRPGLVRSSLSKKRVRDIHPFLSFPIRLFFKQLSRVSCPPQCSSPVTAGLQLSPVVEILGGLPCSSRRDLTLS